MSALVRRESVERFQYRFAWRVTASRTLTLNPPLPPCTVNLVPTPTSPTAPWLQLGTDSQFAIQPRPAGGEVSHCAAVVEEAVLRRRIQPWSCFSARHGEPSEEDSGAVSPTSVLVSSEDNARCSAIVRLSACRDSRRIRSGAEWPSVRFPTPPRRQRRPPLATSPLRVQARASGPFR